MGGICTIRVDASPWIGVGHLSRCLTLAQELRRLGVEVHFVSRDHPGAALWLVEEERFPLHRLPVGTLPVNPMDHRRWLGATWQEDADATRNLIRDTLGETDWLVVDHYSLGEEWETALRSRARRLLVIDDLAERRHDCEILLDQSLRDDDPYEKLVPPYADRLLGPRFSLLREEFRRARARPRGRDGEIRRINIFFGGSDPTGDTLKTVRALSSGLADLELEVIVGAMNPQKDRIATLCAARPRTYFFCQVSDMATRLGQADLAIGGAGVSSWERLAVGLPAVVIEQTDNQKENARQLHRHGVALSLGRSDQVDEQGIFLGVHQFVTNPALVRSMSEKAQLMVDAKGAERVAAKMSART